MRSPLPLDAVLNYPDAVSQVTADGDAVYWLASIAAEDGRTTVRRMRDGRVVDVTPEASVRSRAMEYGGGAYAVDAGTVAWCDDRTSRVWVRAGDAAARPLTPASGPYVYGGLVLSVKDGAVLAVREDHSAMKEPRTEIVRIGLDGGDDAGIVLVTGADFYASIALREGRLAWQQWDHPSMSWDTSSVWSAPLADPSAATPAWDEDGVSAGYPVWLPSGGLAFVADETGFWNWRLEDGTIWATDHDCAGPLWVLNPPVAAALDDDRIATVSYADGRGRLAVWDPATGEVDLPLPGTTDIESVAVAAGGTILVVAEWPDRGRSLVAIRGDGSTATLAGSTLPDRGAVVARPVWVDAESGPVHSWLYLPAGSTPPLLVMTHGGPTSMATAGYDMTVQFWVSRGFAVLDVNYSGSTGFGRAYRDRLKGRWGIYDVTDTAAAVTAVTQAGLADAARVAITGGSAGGFTTLASLTSTDVYRAGISRYGIGDLTTLVTDTHKAESRYPESLIAPWPQGRAVYEERSPVNHLDRLSTPMLILQGTEDKVVPPNQAIQMAEAVRAAGQPVALLMLEGEGHGFRAMATRRRALEAQVSFLEQVFGMAPSRDVPLLPIENLQAGDA